MGNANEGYVRRHEGNRHAYIVQELSVVVDFFCSLRPKIQPGKWLEAELDILEELLRDLRGPQHHVDTSQEIQHSHPSGCRT